MKPNQNGTNEPKTECSTTIIQKETETNQNATPLKTAN